MIINAQTKLQVQCYNVKHEFSNLVRTKIANGTLKCALVQPVQLCGKSYYFLLIGHKISNFGPAKLKLIRVSKHTHRMIESLKKVSNPQNKNICVINNSHPSHIQSYY